MSETTESNLAILESRREELEAQIKSVHEQFGLLRLKFTEGGSPTEEDRRESERLYHELSQLNAELEQTRLDIEHKSRQ